MAVVVVRADNVIAETRALWSSADEDCGEAREDICSRPVARIGVRQCESCALSCASLGSCTSLSSVLMLALRVRLRCVVLVELLGPPTAS